MRLGQVRAPTSDCEATAARDKTFFFGVVLPVAQTHIFGHYIAVIPRRTKRIFRNEPAIGKNDEIAVRRAGFRLGEVKTVKIEGSG